MIKTVMFMSEKLFREKSIDRISSPEKLDNYLKVSTPSLWFVMIGVISILVGILVWASVEKLETKINAVASVNNKNVEIVLTGNDAEKVKTEMKYYIGKQEGLIDYIQYDDLGRAIAVSNIDVPDGNYKVEIVLESIHPISFLFR